MHVLPATVPPHFFRCPRRDNYVPYGHTASFVIYLDPDFAFAYVDFLKCIISAAVIIFLTYTTSDSPHTIFLRTPHYSLRSIPFLPSRDCTLSSLHAAPNIDCTTPH